MAFPPGLLWRGAQAAREITTFSRPVRMSAICSAWPRQSASASLDLARLERAQDAFMLVPHADAQVALAQRGRHHAAQMLPVRLGGLADQRIARRLVDEEMEVDVGLDDRGHVAARHGPPADIEQQPAALHEVRRVVRRGQPCRGAVERAAHDIEVARLLDVERRHADALAAGIRPGTLRAAAASWPAAPAGAMTPNCWASSSWVMRAPDFSSPEQMASRTASWMRSLRSGSGRKGRMCLYTEHRSREVTN